MSFLKLTDDDGGFIANASAVTDMLALAAEDEWSEGSVILHRFKKENLSVSRKRDLNFRFECKYGIGIVTKGRRAAS